jgi:predicted dehydrogenase
MNWALDHGLSVLLDKPLSIHENCSVDPVPAAAILTDFEELVERYRGTRTWKPEILLSVHCQRRYHPAFLKMRELISEVAEATNCPVTSIQSFHSDGQWRTPDELLDISYHSFDRGYGKCAHSGYHFFDIVPWLIQAGERPGKEVDTVEVYGNFLRPGDLLAQLGIEDYTVFVPGFPTQNPYSTQELLARTKEFGEVDAFLSMAYKSGGRIMTLGSMNLLHNGYSQRGRHKAHPADLYKGNGRVRQESHIIQQGPFQAIHYYSWQTAATGGPDGMSQRDGSSEHVELHILRNAGFNPKWQPHARLDQEALTMQSPTGPWLPTQSDSRQRAIREFLEYINGLRDRDDLRSELTDHRRSVVLMSGAYLSAAQQWVGRAPVAVLDFGTTSKDDVLEVR